MDEKERLAYARNISHTMMQMSLRLNDARQRKQLYELRTTLFELTNGSASHSPNLRELVPFSKKIKAFSNTLREPFKEDLSDIAMLVFTLATGDEVLLARDKKNILFMITEWDRKYKRS